MKVNFNPDIELLIREVKMLKILGYVIPLEIEKVSETGRKFLQQAKSLEQVCLRTKWCNNYPVVVVIEIILNTF